MINVVNGPPDLLQIAEYILNKGANPNLSDCENKNRTPLIFAAQYGYSSLMELLIQHGANVNLIDSDGKTAMQEALSIPPLFPFFSNSTQGRWKGVLLLLRSGASWDYNNILRFLVLTPCAINMEISESIVNEPWTPKPIKFLVTLQCFISIATSRITYHVLFDPGIKRIFNALFTAIKRHL